MVPGSHLVFVRQRGRRSEPRGRIPVHEAVAELAQPSDDAVLRGEFQGTKDRVPVETVGGVLVEGLAGPEVGALGLLGGRAVQPPGVRAEMAPAAPSRGDVAQPGSVFIPRPRFEHRGKGPVRSLRLSSVWRGASLGRPLRCRRRGQVGQVPRWARQQAHHRYRLVGLHDQLPLARSIPESAFDVVGAGFQLLCRQGPRCRGRH